MLFRSPKPQTPNPKPQTPNPINFKAFRIFYKMTDVDSVRFDEFVAMFKELSLDDRYLDMLTENGFDEWISLIEVNELVLQDIGIQNETDRQQIVACVEAAQSIKPEDCSNIGPSRNSTHKNFKAGQQMTSDDFKYSQSGPYIKLEHGNDAANGHLKESIQMEESYDEFPMYAQSRNPRIESEYVNDIKPVPLVISKVEKYSFKKINKGESENHYFGRILHLYVKQAGINSTVNIERFPSLRVLDLSDNPLSTIQNMQGLSNLEQLTMENCKIDRLTGLDYLYRLKKLYASKNNINRLEGLKYCQSLQDLRISHQRVSNGEFFTIEDDSMIGVSESLISLEMDSVRCMEISGLQYLRRPLLT